MGLLSLKAPASGQLPVFSFAMLFAVAITIAIGNAGMQSLLPAIGRELGLADTMVSAIFALSAVMMVVMTPYWAVRSDRVGRKPMLLVGLAGFAVSMTVWGVVIMVGARHLVTPLVLFVLLLCGRGIMGVFMAALAPAQQAYVAERTVAEARTQAISALAGAFGFGMIFGPLVAPILVFPVVGLAGPLFIFAAFGLCVLALVVRWLPETWPPPGFQPRDPSQEAGAKPPVIVFDARVRGFMIACLLVSACQVGLTQAVGFLVIDELKVSPADALGPIGIAMTASAVATVAAQWGLVPLLRLTPRQLLRWGAVLASVGAAMVAFSPAFWVIVTGFAVFSLGVAFLRPGYTAGASLAVELPDQARTAGAIMSISGGVFVLGPLFMILYGVMHAAPFVLAAVLMAGLLVYAFVDPALKRAGAVS